MSNQKQGEKNKCRPAKNWSSVGARMTRNRTDNKRPTSAVVDADQKNIGFARRNVGIQYARNSSSPTKTAGIAYFGGLISDHVMEDLLFRFLYNIPENEKQSRIRVCFQVEQAHWFYVDFYCSTDKYECKKLGFREFVRQVFFKCDYLKKWKDDVEAIIEEFRFYKANVPTYGVVLLDSTLNYVLLVQGYFASKNSWGFPKGKVNEDEIPIQCAIREVYEETGFDATEKIVSNQRPLQSFLNDTLIRLYIATDVPMDYPFEPHLRKEIRKISWFSVWDLPKGRTDEKGCQKLGLQPRNFYTVLPFVNQIHAFVRKEQAKRQKPKVTILRKDSSAFQPVIPRTVSRSNFSDEDFSPVGGVESADRPSCSKRVERDERNLFKPLSLDQSAANESRSFTGQAFLRKFVLHSQSPSTSQNVESLPPQIDQGEIKQPKPLHTSLIINVYNARSSSDNSPENAPKSSKEADDDGGTKAFNSIFENLQKSASDVPVPSTNNSNAMSASATGFSKAPGANRKNVGAVGELVNDAQRSKLKEHQQNKRRQKQEKAKEKKAMITGIATTRSPNEQPQQKKSLHDAMQTGDVVYIPVDLAQLFGSSVKNNASNEDDNKPSTSKGPILLSSPDCEQPGSSTQHCIVQCPSSSNVSTSPVGPSTSSALRNLNYFNRPRIQLCKAWSNFKLDLTRISFETA